RLLLAPDDAAFARDLGIDLSVRSGGGGPLKVVLGGKDFLLSPGRTRVERAGGAGRAWASAGGEPFVTVYPHGRGEVWLVHRPDFLTNEQVGEADNAVLLCRLAEAMLEEDSDRIDFDEFFHG